MNSKNTQFKLQLSPFLLGNKTQIVWGGASRRLTLFGFWFVLIQVTIAIKRLAKPVFLVKLELDKSFPKRQQDQVQQQSVYQLPNN